MNSTIEELYRGIGQAALGIADDLSGKLLIYAEVEDGVISCDLFYLSTAGMVRFRFGSDTMKKLIYSLWERWQEDPDNHEWRVMTYVIEGGKFRIDFTYPDQIKKQEAISDRRPLAVKKYFDDMKVDYSQP